MSYITDVCESRHKGNAASVAANPAQTDKAVMRARVFRIIEQKGVTFSKEIARELGMPLNCISGRISELKALGLIQETDERFEKCAGLCLTFQLRG
jgi:predicted transcriptional regulator